MNLMGTLFGIQEVASRWIAEKTTGPIVNVSSLNALAGLAGQAHYGASKAGVVSLTQTAAVELAMHGIRVNVVLPGSTATPMGMARLQDPHQRAEFEERIPLGRIADPRDIANVIAFLLSPESGYMTGAVVRVDGGWTAAI
jgi:NAD(P)-dependent dehydrogenase (short-subunit alcohol dehydrogenase family)